MNTQLAKAYALLCIDAVKTLNITFDALFEKTTDPISFSNLGLTLTPIAFNLITSSKLVQL